MCKLAFVGGDVTILSDPIAARSDRVPYRPDDHETEFTLSSGVSLPTKMEVYTLTVEVYSKTPPHYYSSQLYYSIVHIYTRTVSAL